MPQAPATANLDITTLCALVSGLTHGAAHRADAAALALLHKGWFQARGGPGAEHSIWFCLELALSVSQVHQAHTNVISGWAADLKYSQGRSPVTVKVDNVGGWEGVLARMPCSLFM